jgi:hypothetical protein
LALRPRYHEEECCIFNPMQTINDENDLLKTRLTQEEIRNIKGFENISDDEAENIADTVFTLASIIFDYYGKE